MIYSIASNWDDELLEGLSKLNSKYNNKVIEVFGSSAYSFFGSANAGIPDIGKNEIERKIKKAKLLGFKFNYLVNSSVCPKIETQEGLKKALDYFKWLESMKIDSVTIANEQLMDFVYNNFPKLKINVSIVARIKTVDEINNLRIKYPSIQRVILYQFVNRDKNLILEHVKNARLQKSRSKSIETELLANEICLHQCSRMQDHYLSLSVFSQKKNKTGFDYSLCRSVRAGDVNEFLNSSWIRPEDASLYEELGVDILKIAGRKEFINNLLMRAEAYLSAKFDGNVMDLFLA